MELGAGYPEIVTLCRGGLDTLHANRTPHHQMKVLICSEMLLPLIMVAIALAFSSSQSLYLFSFFHHLVMLFFYVSLSCSPQASVLLMSTLCVCFYYTAMRYLHKKKWTVERKPRLCVS